MTTIIREQPARGATVRGAPFAAEATRAVALIFDARGHSGFVLGWTAAGACLWPATVGALALVAPPMASLQERGEWPPGAERAAAWYFAACLVAGAAVGAAQWLVLRSAFRPRRVAVWWVPATALGWALAMLAFMRAGLVMDALAAWVPAYRAAMAGPLAERAALTGLVAAPWGALVGLLLGGAQWLAARRDLPRSYVAAAALGFALGCASLAAVPRLPDRVSLAPRWFSSGQELLLPGLAMTGALYGALTAVSLTGTIRRRTKTS